MEFTVRKFLRSPLSWFANKTDSVEASLDIHDASLEDSNFSHVQSPINSLVDIADEDILGAETKLDFSEGIELERPQMDVVVEFSNLHSEPIIEVIELREPGPLVQLMKRGPRLYSICPHCEASWSLRDRLFDPRTGRPCSLDALVCPACLKSVSLPSDLDLRKVQ
jgi:hypothetical protein